MVSWKELNPSNTGGLFVMQSLREYSQFETVQEMDKAINEALITFDLKESERAVLLKLSQYSCRFVGVSYLKTCSLAGFVGLSQRTVKRCLRSLSDKGIITRVKQLRPLSGGWGASVTVINTPKSHLVESPRPESETPEETSNQEPPHQSETINSKAKISLKNKERRKDSELDYTYLESGIVPESFVRACKPFIESAKEIYTLYKKALHAGSVYSPDVIDCTEIAIQAFKQTVFSKKMNKIRSTFNGFYYGCLRNMLTVEQRRVKTNEVSFGDWLED